MISSKPKARFTKQDLPEGQGGIAASAQPLDHSSLSQNEVAILAETFRLLGDPSRLKILLTCLPGPISVGDIAEKLDLSLSLVSHHLRLLRGARLVRGERQAKQIFYEIADQHVSQVLQDMATHISEDHTDE
ncbi:ArsR/SmtB family transcription factor [Mesorhizobium delmotii]|uniref:Transcriptional regulator, ArsR family (Modular protein) n=1 Tax=Mesorhizobium delmotii TaxID=1631247 RepID=A0A2P9ARH5_9HYPH|nr:metalloregulator ArsR/SmtB family transcription factor [Mesorhizobium delmotii]SJM33734.1 Transcriptional regulator, ArsR family (Modular protein) [Mesorhizobium delmotii]